MFASIPWGHHLQVITKCKDVNEALFYLAETATHNWSRNILVHQIESGLYQRRGKAVTNFAATLPQPQSDLAHELLKNPYNFDFLTLGESAKERDLEEALIRHITAFLLELGQGFAYMGRQYKLRLEGDEYALDLLFYHTRLRCYVVIELKAGDFKPEYAGKLNFYLNLVDDFVKAADDKPTIGMLLCRNTGGRPRVEYALRGIAKPIGVSEYQLTESIPDELKGSLPSIEDIENSLNDLAS
nr:PDDEXK nuclease domain-containing protein [Cnuella takakiae]